MCSDPKTIAIVAMGYSLMLGRWGEEIDSHDIVVRVNNLKKGLKKETTGLRTDIVISNFSKYGDIDQPEGALLWSTRPQDADRLYPEIYRLPSGNIRFFDNVLSIERELRGLGNAGVDEPYSPSTGIIAIDIIEKEFPTAKIYIYGFDFYGYEKPYCYEDDRADVFTHEDHPIKIEKLYLEKLIRKYPRIHWVRPA